MNKVCETNTKLINVVSSSVFTKNVAVGCQNFKGAEDTKKNHGSAQTAVRLSSFSRVGARQTQVGT